MSLHIQDLSLSGQCTQITVNAFHWKRVLHLKSKSCFFLIFLFWSVAGVSGWFCRKIIDRRPKTSNAIWTVCLQTTINISAQCFLTTNSINLYFTGQKWTDRVIIMDKTYMKISFTACNCYELTSNTKFIRSCTHFPGRWSGIVRSREILSLR